MSLTTEGFITSTTPAIIAEGADSGILIIRLITLYNPNGSAAAFILRKIVEDGNAAGEYTRFDDSIPATDSWTFGLLGTPIMLVMPNQRYEVVLDNAPTLGIHYVVDLGRTL